MSKANVLGVATSYWIIIFHCSFQCQNSYVVSPAVNAASQMSALVVNLDVNGNLEMSRASMMPHTRGATAASIESGNNMV